MDKKQRCTATKADGSPCRAWPVRGSDPPRCAAHGGTPRPIGAPAGSQNALKHGAYASSSSTQQPRVEGQGKPPDDLDERIADLGRKIARLSRYIDDNFDDLVDAGNMLATMALYGQLSNRLGRLKRDRVQVTGDQDSELARAFDEALDIFWERCASDLQINRDETEA